MLFSFLSLYLRHQPDDGGAVVNLLRHERALGRRDEARAVILASRNHVVKHQRVDALVGRKRTRSVQPMDSTASLCDSPHRRHGAVVQDKRRELGLVRRAPGRRVPEIRRARHNLHAR